MPEITDSRLAMYEGFIALAWADHELDSEEKETLNKMIDGNGRFTDEQRNELMAQIDNKTMLKHIWHKITEKKDRARVLDLANIMFHKDGVYCDNEKELYQKFHEKHLESLDFDEIDRDLSAMKQDFDFKRKKLHEEMDAYAKQFGFIPAIKKFVSEFKL